MSKGEREKEKKNLYRETMFRKIILMRVETEKGKKIAAMTIGERRGKTLELRDDDVDDNQS